MKPSLIALALGAAVIGGVAMAQTLSSAEALSRASAIAYDFRAGRYEAAPQALTILRSATAADPRNPDLWVALASAEMQGLTATSQPGGDRTQAMAILQNGFANYEKALAIKPDHPEALAGRGALGTILFAMRGDMKGVAASMADMDRAAQLDPESHVVRLQRGFFGVNLPPQIRQNAKVEEDLKFLIRIGEGQRSGDVLHLLLGDLYAETGRPAEAKSEYRASNRARTTTGDLAVARLQALQTGAVPAPEIARLRSQLGTNCVMCHGK